MILTFVSGTKSAIFNLNVIDPTLLEAIGLVRTITWIGFS